MNLKNKVTVVTGGGKGIGRGLCRRFAEEGARAVVVADLDAIAAQQVANEISGMAVACDVARESDVQKLLKLVSEKHGEIDLFCSNAGIMVPGGVEAPDAGWQHIWDVNVMAHVYAARAVLPGMLKRGGGYLLQTVSAAGLLTIPDAAPYAVTKHAALALAEWLAFTYGDQGIRVSAVCPLGVRTDMLMNDESSIAALLMNTAIEPEAVADAVVRGIAEEKFLILPHPEAGEYFRQKAADHGNWLLAMRRLQASLNAQKPKT
jgi:NAD(P)-dependent dehydrogenase (short-subunit alcohol dehydrogenase family)